MLSTLWPILLELRPAFTHQMTFMWFCTAVVGICMGSDDIGGVTSVTRNLVMSQRGYWGLTRFFGSTAIHLTDLQQAWLTLVIRRLFANPIRVAGRMLVVVDATKVAKRGKRMPGVIGMKDTVNDTWMRGHYFEQLCVVVRSASHLFPVPVAITMLSGLLEKEDHGKTLADRCRDFIASFPALEGCLIVGDAWYSKSKLIIGLAKQRSIAMVTRIAHNAVAFEPYIASPLDPRRRGRKRKYGAKIKLWDLFSGPLEAWTVTDNSGRELTVHGWCRDLIWEQLGLVVRFVGVSHSEKGKWILLCSDTRISPQDIAQAYVYRFWIEVGFHTAKSLLGSFTYRFWTKAMEKLSSFPKELDLSGLPIDLAERIRQKAAAINLFATCSMIAQGLLVYLCINYGEQVANGARFWLRTKRGDVACERLAAAYIGIEIRNLAQAKPDGVALEKFIQERQDSDYIPGEIREKPAA